MSTRQKWVGIIVVLVALLFASAGVGQARGGGHGFGGHGFHQGFHQGFHHLEGSIGLAAHGSASASARSGGHTVDPMPTRMRVRRGLWLPLPSMPHPSGRA